jgi:hypothetical protein
MAFVGCGERKRTAPLADVVVLDAILKDLTLSLLTLSL